MSDIRNPGHVTDDDLILYIQGQLGPGRLSAIDPHLLHCDICRERLSRNIGSKLMFHLIGGGKAGQKRERSEPRFCTGSDAILQKLSPFSLDRQTVRIVDISKNGLGILAAKAGVPGTIVQVRINAAVELAEVLHSSASDNVEFRIALRFVAPSDAAAEHFVAHRGAIMGDLQIPLDRQPDRRQTPRQQVSQSALLSVLGTAQVLYGEIRNLGEGGTQILLQEPLRVSSLVKIEYADKLLLGEVIYRQQEKSGWLLGIRVGHSMSGLVPDWAEANALLPMPYGVTLRRPLSPAREV